VIEKQVKGDRFEKSGRRTARIFYPAAQEYGAATAKPPIKAKHQMKRAADTKRISAQRVFRGKFVREFRKFSKEVGFL